MANKETSIFERRWTEADGREWAEQLVNKEIHPNSFNAGLGMGCGTTWIQAVIGHLIYLAQKDDMPKGCRLGCRLQPEKSQAAHQTAHPAE